VSRRAILVVGMHRSGTSATARVLNLLGVPLPGELVPGFEGNPLGHWEPERIVHLHDAMLRDAGSNVNSVFGVDPRWFDTASAARFGDAIRAFVDEEAGGAGLFAVKDPRLSLFLPLWRRVLERAGVQPSYVLAVRDPAAVAASLTARQLSAFPDAVWPRGRADLLWLRYSLTAERDTREGPRAVLAYDRLLGDWRGETRRIARQLGLAWPRDEAAAAPELDTFLHPGRGDGLDEDSVLPWTEAVYAALLAACEDPVSGRETLDLAFAALNDACALFQPYVSGLERRIATTPLRTEYGHFGEPPAPSPPDTPALAREHAQADALRARLAALEASRSWRITAPLRAAVRQLPK
jgi:hypothetical protein